MHKTVDLELMINFIILYFYSSNSIIALCYLNYSCAFSLIALFGKLGGVPKVPRTLVSATNTATVSFKL